MNGSGWARLLLLAAFGCTERSSLPPTPDFAQMFFEEYVGLPAGTLACPKDSEPLRHEGTRYDDEFCGRLDWPGGVEHAGPIRRYGKDGRVWFEGHYGSGRRVGTWLVYRPDGALYARFDFDRGILPCPEGSFAADDHTKDHQFCFDARARAPRGPFLVFARTMRLKLVGVRGPAGREGTWVQWAPDGRVVSVQQFHRDEVVWEHAVP